MRRNGAIGAGALALLAAASAAALAERTSSPESQITVVSGHSPVVAPAAGRASAPRAAVATQPSIISTPVATFKLPWAMAFLPDGRLLVTEKGGTMRVVTTAGAVSAPISGVRPVAFAKQGGLLDVAIDPGFGSNRRIWWTYAEPGDGGAALAVARGTLGPDSAAPRLDDVRVIWRQHPRIDSSQQFGGRLAFAPDGGLFVTAGDRKAIDLVQAQGNTIGKVVRIDPTGATRPDIWTLGNRNPYGLAFASDGRLFESEMGPMGGDEFNVILPRRNYGWPNVSEGDQYSGQPIPRHSTDPRYTAPLVAWTPVIAPGGMIQYRGTLFPALTGEFLLGGMKAEAIVRVRVRGWKASEVGRIPMGARIREVEEGPDGAIWVLEDGSRGRLIRLTPG